MPAATRDTSTHACVPTSNSTRHLTTTPRRHTASSRPCHTTALSPAGSARFSSGMAAVTAAGAQQLTSTAARLPCRATHCCTAAASGCWLRRRAAVLSSSVNDSQAGVPARSQAGRQAGTQTRCVHHPARPNSRSGTASTLATHTHDDACATSAASLRAPHRVRRVLLRAGLRAPPPRWTASLPGAHRRAARAPPQWLRILAACRPRRAGRASGSCGHGRAAHTGGERGTIGRSAGASTHARCTPRRSAHVPFAQWRQTARDQHLAPRRRCCCLARQPRSCLRCVHGSGACSPSAGRAHVQAPHAGVNHCARLARTAHAPQLALAGRPLCPPCPGCAPSPQSCWS